MLNFVEFEDINHRTVCIFIDKITKITFDKDRPDEVRISTVDGPTNIRIEGSENAYKEVMDKISRANTMLDVRVRKF